MNGVFFFHPPSPTLLGYRHDKPRDPRLTVHVPATLLGHEVRQRICRELPEKPGACRLLVHQTPWIGLDDVFFFFSV